MEMNGGENNVEAGIIEQEGESSLQRTNGTNGEYEKEKNDAAAEEEMSVEKIFVCKEVPSWRNQLTVRAFVVSFFMSVMFCVIVMKLDFTIGIIPSFNVSAGLLGFFFIKSWTRALEKTGVLRQPFTRQENTVIQTCVVASSGVAFSGGFGSYLLAMSERVVAQSEGSKTRLSYKNPQFGWMIGFLLVVCFRGLFTVVPLSKILVIDFRLKYPSGTATAYLINSFHTPKEARLAKQQVRTIGKFLSFSFLWGVFQWLFTAGNNCGFESFPAFGLKAYENKFYFDFSTTYVGVGMICPHIINVSLLVGGILSWGIMWPLIKNKEGDWYPAGLGHSNLQGLQGYKVSIGLSMILGDGLYNSFKVLSTTVAGLIRKIQGRDPSLVDSSSSKPPSFDDQRRSQFFLKDQIPTRFAVGGYVIITAFSGIVLPHIFPQLKLYHIIVIYIFAPMLAFCNAFGCGLTDWSLASSYGKLAIFTIGAWVGASHDGVLAGLAAGGIIMNMVSTSSDLMQDLKTGYMTLASPRSMFASQLIGTAFGCVIAPSVFWIFYQAFPDLGKPESAYPAPFAIIYYNMAKLGVEGFSALPKNCLKLCYGFFCAAILINIIRDDLGKKRGRFIPLPMAMAIPFYLGSYFAIDMCVGSLILYIWQKKNKAKADAFAPAVASGLICGDGLWTLPSSILALIGVKPPICMKFLSRSTNRKVDIFLGS